MSILRSELRHIRSSDDLVIIRQVARDCAKSVGMNLIDQTKIITAASELGRNIYLYAGSGIVRFEILNDGLRSGLRLTFEDHGPGIADVELAMKDGYTTSGGMGLGLGGAKRLSNEFTISSKPGEGTTVVITRWR